MRGGRAGRNRGPHECARCPPSSGGRRVCSLITPHHSSCSLACHACCDAAPAAVLSHPGRLEELAAKEEERHETLLCVNRLWEELNASIGFIQYR